MRIGYVNATMLHLNFKSILNIRWKKNGRTSKTTITSHYTIRMGNTDRSVCVCVSFDNEINWINSNKNIRWACTTIYFTCNLFEVKQKSSSTKNPQHPKSIESVQSKCTAELNESSENVCKKKWVHSIIMAEVGCEIFAYASTASYRLICTVFFVCS